MLDHVVQFSKCQGVIGVFKTKGKQVTVPRESCNARTNWQHSLEDKLNTDAAMRSPTVQQQ